MFLPLCLPEKLDCAQNIKAIYEECLPQCSGFWMESSKNYDEAFPKKKIIQLSKQYWNNKGYYKFSSYSGM